MEIQNKDLLQKLNRSGFTDKESLVYVSLLELGGAYPSRIAQYCNLRRSTVYNILLSLSVRGIVNEIEKKNKSFYQIENPEKIKRYVNNKLQQVKDTADNLDKVIPEIFSLYNIGSNSPKVTYYSGRENLLSIYDDMVAYKKPYEMLSFTSAEKFSYIMKKNDADKYFKAKQKIGITTRTIVPDTKENRMVIAKICENIDKKYWPNSRFVEEKTFPSVTETVIYSPNKVAIINLDEKSPTGVIIEDPAIHNMMKAIFELSWNSRSVKE